MPGLFDDLPAAGGVKPKALFDDLPDAADPDSFEAQEARSGLSRREAKRLLLEAEMLGQRAFPEPTEDRSTFEKARNQAAGTAARGAASVVEGLKVLAVPPPRTPNARRMFERSMSDPRWMDPGFLLQNEALIALGVDPVKASLMEERHAPWRQSKHEVDRFLAPIQEPLAERGEAALQVAEATPGNEGVAEIAGGVASAVPTLLAAPAGPAAAVSVAGLQSAGAVKTEARDAYLRMGLPDYQAEELSTDAAVLSGLSTAVVTAGTGSILGRQGVEGWTRTALVNRLAKVQPIRHVIGEVFKEAGAEGVEESVDQAIQSAIAAKSYRPDLTWQQAVDESIQAGLLGGVSGGVITAPMAAAGLSRLSKSQLSKDAARMIEEELSRPLSANASRTAKVMELAHGPLIKDVYPTFQESPTQPSTESAAKAGGVSNTSTVGSVRVDRLVAVEPEIEDVPATLVSADSLPSAKVTDASEPAEQLADGVKQPEPAGQTGVLEPADNRIETLVTARRSKSNVPVADFKVGQTPDGTWSYTFQLNGTSSGYGVPWTGKFESRELAVNGGLMAAYRWLRGTQARRDNSKADLKSLGQIESLLKPLLAKPEQRKPAPWETGSGGAKIPPSPLFADLPSSPSAALATTVAEPTLSTPNEPETHNAASVDYGEQFRAVATTGQPALAAASGVDEGAPTGAGAEPVAGEPTRQASRPEGGTGAGSDPQGQGGGTQRGRGSRASRRSSDSATGRAGDPGTRAGTIEPGNPQATPPLGTQSGPPPDLTAENHVIALDDVLAPAGDKAKARGNLDAVHLLRRLEAVGRNATPAEKKTLAQYVGWGGLKPLFDHAKARYRTTEPAWEKTWGKLYDETLKTLTEEEYAAANRSILNAHYTSREVVDGIWAAVRRLGFEGGSVLEPSAGVGHFFGLMPRDFAAKSSLHAVELDSISARILAKLYPQARVQATGFETARLPNNSMDLVIGNVPFAKEGPYDPRYPRLSLHNYFFVRV